ncbi:MAG: hypothetical protein LBM22_00990 [Endomicrobium sp.]|jgi:F0F1-type ATP synthase delta subunit|nr:hypothetical protein [Endomicrobium sp.]
MTKIQINNIIQSIVKHNELSDNGLNWICSHLSIRELKRFKSLLCKEIKNKTVFIYFAGILNDNDKYKIINMFSNHKVRCIRNDKKIIGGIYIEYNYSIYDCTITTLITRIVKQIKSK